MITLLLIYLGVLVTWTWYLATMMLKHRRDEGMKFTFEQKVFGYPMMVGGLVILDSIIMNMIIATILMFEVPKEWLYTDRCKRHMNEDGWRGKVARWSCRHFLDPFEEGGHC